MINSLWISKTGMEAQQTQLDVISHNLANVSTTGFKRSNAVFEDLIYQNLRQVGANNTEAEQLPTGLQLGLGVRTVATSRQFSQGSLQLTDNHFDVAINGNGFFNIQLPDGTVGYTRDGSFEVDSQGRLVTSNGLAVANGITIPAEHAVGEHQRDRHRARDAAGQHRAADGGHASPCPPSSTRPGLEPRGQNIFTETAASGQPQGGTPGTNGLGIMRQGYLETSNVNVVQELVTMIQTQRAYEMNSKAVQTSDQMLQKLAQL
ncbi:MAG: flagellar basal-body rod protein FlgG [Pseudorhodoferax sp.]